MSQSYQQQEQQQQYPSPRMNSNRINQDVTIPFSNKAINNERPTLPPILSNNTSRLWYNTEDTITLSSHQHNNSNTSRMNSYYNTTTTTTSLPQIMTTTPVEFILTPNSILAPSIHHIEKDIDQVIRHCNSLVDNMNERKQTIIENDFNNPTLIRPWLDDMINKANEVLNALLRLRKYQLAAEYRIQHRSNDNDGRIKNNQVPKNSNNSNGIIALNTNNNNRLRKRGKRPVFQGRCHSCNISETPEWRRGPDGARTLCNACGLHYAKLSRKKKEESIIKDDTSMK